MKDKITLDEAVDIVCTCLDEDCGDCQYRRSDKCVENLFHKITPIENLGVFLDNKSQIGPEEVMYYYNNKEVLLKLQEI